MLAALVWVVFLNSLVEGNRFGSLWRYCLMVSVPMEHADAIILLGGEPLARPLEAAHLYRIGVAPRIFVSGIGDAARNRQILLSSGVPVQAITMEAKATTTYSNATLLRPLLVASNVRSALIVTSPFHMRRALATFQKIMPEIKFGVTDATPDWGKGTEGRRKINRLAAIEFLKIFEYWIFYGVSPFLSLPSDHPIVEQ